MKARMDLSTLFGISIAILTVGVAQKLDGGNIQALFNLPAFLIVVGGSVGAVILQTPGLVLLRSLQILAWIVFPPLLDPKELIEKIINISHISRKDGILSLEKSIEGERDVFIRKGLELILDGNTPSEVKQALQVEMESEEYHDLEATQVYDGLGGYSPTFGIIGTVLVLIRIMENISDPSEIGQEIGVAFVATIYGVGFANLIYLPIGSKLKSLVIQRARLKAMLVEGFSAIAEGEHPRLITTRLTGFLQKGML